MRYVLCFLLIPLCSCSLILQADNSEPLPQIPSTLNTTSLSVSDKVANLLLTDDLSTEKFPVVVSRNGGGYCNGTVRLRGQTTLEEYPRSFALDLRQDSTINLQESHVGRVSLIPFRSDTNFIYTLMGLYFFRESDLFIPKLDLTKLSLNGNDLGTYAVIEHTTDAILRNNPTIEFVLRRRYGGFYDLKYYEARDSIHQLTRGDYATAYETLHTLSSLYSGEALQKTLEARMDLKGYLEAQAINCIFANGDYNDEIFYAGEAKRDEQGITAPYFTFSVWDPSELFTEPHLGNFTKGSLIFSNENRFDRMIETTPSLYNYYCVVLQQVLDSLITNENIAACKTHVETLLNKGVVDGSIRFGDQLFEKNAVLSLFDETTILLMKRKREIQSELALRNKRAIFLDNPHY